MSSPSTDSPGRIPREVVAALAGAEAGAGIGLLGFGGRLMAPLALAACGAATGPLLAVGVRRLRLLLFARLLRAQLRLHD
jgi:hypothetical protein